MNKRANSYIMKILHVFKDDKFFDKVSVNFNKIIGIENLYIFFSENKNHIFKYIQDSQKIKIITNKEEYLRLFSDSDIQIIFFHALPFSYYEYVLKTSSEKTIIWWSWGYDLYSTRLIDLNLYKPLTLHFVKEKKKIINLQTKFGVKSCANKIFSLLSRIKDKKVISRIDLCVTTLPIEFELLSKKKYFKAKQFMERAFFSPFVNLYMTSTPPIVSNILLGNSATYENNHLDIFSLLNEIKINKKRKIIVPLSYGNNEYAQKIKKKLSDNYQVLDDFLSYEEYIKVIGTCSHAIFGVIRQQALGNIYMCMRKGIKVFLYNDSLTYLQFKKDGFIVYSITDDLNEKSLSESLTQEQMVHNQKKLEQIYTRSGFEALQEGINKIKNKSLQSLDSV